MRPEAREMTQHGGPPGWLENGRSMPPSLTDSIACPACFGAAQMQASGKSSCFCLCCSTLCTQNTVMSKEDMGQKSS
jgi:hypothetical protein